MEFKRKKKRGYNQKTCRFWFSEDGYRIIWRCEAFGIALPPGFQATVRVMLPSGREMWDFVGRRLFKTLKAAQEACEKHQRLWAKAVEATGIRKLEELFGKVPSGYPLWIRPKLNRNVYGLLMDTSTRKRKDIEICDLDPDALTRISASFASGMDATRDGPTPVSPAEVKGKSVSLTTENDTELNDAPPATEPAKAPRKRAARRTSTPSKPTSKRKTEYQRLCYYRKEALKRLSKEEVKALRELGV